MSNWKIKIEEILKGNTDDLAAIAKSIGADPETFYTYCNLQNTDLTGQDLRGFNFKGSNFKGAKLFGVKFSFGSLDEGIFDEGVDITQLYCVDDDAVASGGFYIGTIDQVDDNESFKDAHYAPEMMVVKIENRGVFALGRMFVTYEEMQHFRDVSGFSEFIDTDLSVNGSIFSWREANAYCQWLREITNQPYRLPTVNEIKLALENESWFKHQMEMLSKTDVEHNTDRDIISSDKFIGPVFRFRVARDFLHLKK